LSQFIAVLTVTFPLPPSCPPDRFSVSTEVFALSVVLDTPTFSVPTLKPVPLFVLVMVWISPWLAIPSVVVFGIIVITGSIAQHRLHELSETTYRASAQRNATLIESLTGIETIKTQGAEGVIQARWERANHFLARVNVRMRGLSSGAMYASSWLSQLVTVSTVIIGVYLIAQRELTMGALIAAGIYSVVRTSLAGPPWQRGLKFGLIAALFGLINALGYRGVFNLPDDIWQWWIVDATILHLVGGIVLGVVADKVSPVRG